MFSFAAHTAARFARGTVFITLCNRSRLLSVSTVSCKNNLYKDSILLSEKPSKSAKAKKSNDKKWVESQLYPDEMRELANYNMVEEFGSLIDDNIQKNPRSGNVKSVAEKSEAVEGFNISEIEEIQLKDNASSERLSDSDNETLSDSDSESEAEAEVSYGKRNRLQNNFLVDLPKLKVARLSRRSDFFREKMDTANLERDKLIVNDDIYGIFELAKLGVTPDILFFCSLNALKHFPADLSNTDLYQVPIQDIKYWSSRRRAPALLAIGIYKKKNLKLNTNSSEPEMPLTIICDQVWHRISFANILNSVFISPPKLFITSKDCLNPWCGDVLRNSLGRGLMLNHDFSLTWKEILEKIDGKDRVYLLEVPPHREDLPGETEHHWSHLPSVDLYNHDFWDTGNITLIAMRSLEGKVPQELSNLLSERNAARINTGVTNKTIGLTAFHMVFFELRRQWFAAGSRDLSKNDWKKRNTAKSQVRIVSSLFKT